MKVSSVASNDINLRIIMFRKFRVESPASWDDECKA